MPLILIFLGGAIGGFCGGLGAAVSSRVFRADLSQPLKYAFTGLIAMGSFCTYWVVATAVLNAIKK